MAIRAYNHEQTVAATIWSITHNLDVLAPIVSVNVYVNGTLTKIIPKDIRVVNSNTVEVEFSSAQTGIARII